MLSRRLVLTTLTLTVAAGTGPAHARNDRDALGARQATASVAPPDEAEALAPGSPSPEPPVELTLPAPRDPLALDVLDLDRLIAEVLRRNPGVEAARQAWLAALAEPRTAGVLPDPMVTYGFAPLSVGGTDVPFGQRIELSQSLPFAGKRRLQAQAAQANADAAQHDVQSLRLDLALASAMLFADYYVAFRAAEINTDQRRLLEDLQRVATAHVSAGEAPLADPLQAETEVAHGEHEALLLGSERRVLAARLNALLHRPLDAPLPPPPNEWPVAPPPPGPDFALLESQALAARPEILRSEAMVRAGQLDVDLARRNGQPDLEVMGAYDSMWSDPEHRWMVGVGVSLPVHGASLRAQREQAAAKLAQARSEGDRMRDDVRVEVRAAAERLTEAHHVLELFRSRLMPAASDRSRAARSAFETGTGTFAGLIAAERELRDVRLALEQATADTGRRLAEFWRATGQLPTSVGAPPPTADAMEPNRANTTTSNPTDPRGGTP